MPNWHHTGLQENVQNMYFPCVFHYSMTFPGTCDYVRLHVLVSQTSNKHQNSVTFKAILTNPARPPWGPTMVRQKYDHPKGMPKTPQGNLTNHSFSEHILQVLLFRIHLVVAPSVPFFVKKAKKRWFYNISDTLAGPNMGHQKEHQKWKNERHAAWERSSKKKNECHAARERFLYFHGPDWSRTWSPKSVPNRYF